MFPAVVSAQSLLTLKDVIDTTLKNSFDIQIAGNNLLIAQKYNSFGVAGGLPYLDASASGNTGVNDIYQKYSDGSEMSLGGINENTLNAGVEMGMTLFNGFKVMATKKRLSLLEKQNEYLLNYGIQSAMASVMIRYYDIVRQQYYLKIMEHLQDVSEKKLEIVNTRKDVGMASGVNILQAQIDVNMARENVKQQILIVDQAKADLLLLMSSKSFYPFTINDTITIDPTINFDTVSSRLKQNPLYLSVMQQSKISEQISKEASAQLYPSLKLGASYDYLVNDNSAGATLMNRIYGPSAGLTLQIPLYYGGTYRAQREAAIIGISNARLMEESTRLTLEAEALKLYQSYKKNLEQIEEQQKSYEMAKELVDLVMQNFKMNQATIIDVKTAQTTYENAGYLLVNMQYTAKSAEIQLLSLMFMLK